VLEPQADREDPVWSIIECLALGLESSDDLRGIHAGLDDLDGDATLNGVELFGQPDLAHTALPDSLQQMVGSKA
jgi:hypothetical protein